MPKTYKRRKASAKASSRQSRVASAQISASSTKKAPATPMSNANANGTNATLANRTFFSPRVTGPQSLIFPAMIAAGCWLMAYTLIFLTNDTNRYLIGGLAVLVALLWTFSFGIRVRKLLTMRQRSR
jgi:hypothetical protein